MTSTWDPERYLAFAEERGRPFVDLIARIRAEHPRRVVDLGCGPGNLTGLLARRWPAAEVVGVDSSPAMVEKATALSDGIGYEVGDLRTWQPPTGGVDVLVSNAALQWVPGHLDLLPGLVSHVGPGGWFAFQVPGNFDEPSHTVRRELEAESPYAGHLGGLDRPGSHDPEVYLRALQPLAEHVDAWETTYLHVLHGGSDPDPVFAWISGTSARPALDRLETADPALRSSFESELKKRLRAAYPDDGHGVVLPFRRVFVVARRAS